MATKPRNSIGKGTRDSFLPTYSMLLSFISGPLPPRHPSGSAAGLFDGGIGFPVGMVLDIKANGGFKLSDVRITPSGRLSLFTFLSGPNRVLYRPFQFEGDSSPPLGDMKQSPPELGKTVYSARAKYFTCKGLKAIPTLRSWVDGADRILPKTPLQLPRRWAMRALRQRQFSKRRPNPASKW